MPARVGVGRRLAALRIDPVIIVAGGATIGGMLGGMLGANMGSKSGDAAALVGFLGVFLGILVGIMIFSLLYGLLEASVGASLGKMILGIKIANEDGTHASMFRLYWRYTIKNIASAIAFVAIFLPFIAPIVAPASPIIFLGCFLALGSQSQALHDRLASTAVYRRTELR